MMPDNLSVNLSLCLCNQATTTHAVINVMKKAKSTKVSVSQDEYGVRFGRNGQPSTTGGLYVNETVMSVIKAKNLFEV